MARAKSALIQVHASVFLFGLSRLFGKFLALPATVIVLGRTGVYGIALAALLLDELPTLRTLVVGSVVVGTTA